MTRDATNKMLVMACNRKLDLLPSGSEEHEVLLFGSIQQEYRMLLNSGNKRNRKTAPKLYIKKKKRYETSGMASLGQEKFRPPPLLFENSMCSFTSPVRLHFSHISFYVCRIVIIKWSKKGTKRHKKAYNVW